MKPNRIGTTYEFKEGHYYLTITDFHDNHYEIEIHKCVPQPVFHSCDLKDLKEAKEIFMKLTREEKHARKSLAEAMKEEGMLEVLELDKKG